MDKDVIISKINIEEFTDQELADLDKEMLREYGVKFEDFARITNYFLDKQSTVRYAVIREYLLFNQLMTLVTKGLVTPEVKFMNQKDDFAKPNDCDMVFKISEKGMEQVEDLYSERAMPHSFFVLNTPVEMLIQAQNLNLI